MDRRTQPDPVAPDAHSEFAQKPQIGAVDGTVAMGEGDELGFLFLFNPGMVLLNASLRVDESPRDCECLGGCGVTVTELHPRPHTTVDVWEHSEAVRVAVPASAARVLQLSKRSSAMDRSTLRRYSLQGALPRTASASCAAERADWADTAHRQHRRHL